MLLRLHSLLPVSRRDSELLDFFSYIPAQSRPRALFSNEKIQDRSSREAQSKKRPEMTTFPAFSHIKTLLHSGPSQGNILIHHLWCRSLVHEEGGEKARGPRIICPVV